MKPIIDGWRTNAKQLGELVEYHGDYIPLTQEMVDKVSYNVFKEAALPSGDLLRLLTYMEVGHANVNYAAMGGDVRAKGLVTCAAALSLGDELGCGSPRLGACQRRWRRWRRRPDDLA